MKILLTGGSGLLGRAVKLNLENKRYQIVAPTHQMYNLEDVEVVQKLVETVKPELIINCAAQRKPDLCESESAAVEALNVTLPTQLAKTGIPLIHLSTDYVFDGTSAPYEVDARRRPLNAYGRQKAAAEIAIEGVPNVLILRVPLLFGPLEDWSHSAVTVLAHNLLLTDSAPVLMDDHAIRYPTFTPDVAQQISALIPYVGQLHGIFHYTGMEAMTKYLMGLTMAPMIGCSCERCRPDDRPSLVPRPYDCHLSVRRLWQTGLYVTPTPFRKALHLIF
ncbi:MAG: SDR family oxidoreductase [Kiritimatiellia bacterium]